MKSPLMILLAAAIAATSFVGWRIQAMRHEVTNDYEAEYDPSLSFTGGCPAVVGSVEQLLHNAGVSAASTLTVLTLGDTSTAYEPRQLATYSIPAERKVIEGRRAGAERRQQLLEDLWMRCRSVHPTLTTPLYLGVQQALADLRAKGCKTGSRCGLWVATDLEENGDREIEGRIKGKHAPSRTFPKPLDNSGIAVTFCGFAQTTGRLIGPSGREIGKPTIRDPHRDDRLQAVWRSLFTQPGHVRFEPYCPAPNNSQSYKSHMTARH